MAEGNAFTPQSIKDQRAGVRRSVAPLLAMVDTEDPAFKQIAAALQSMKVAGVELDEAAIAIAVKLGQQQHRDSLPGSWHKRHSAPERQSIVYYIRRAELIKIGTTTSPFQRCSSLRPDAILAFEPGGLDLEANRHRQFAWCRVAKRGEYFRPSPGLIAHIEATLAEHGPPDPLWPTVSTLGQGSVRTRRRPELPEPTSGEMATASEGAKILGMNKSTVVGWAHRGLIQPAGENEKGYPIYYVEHMKFLIERHRRWMNHKELPGDHAA
ncbi:hypothetical protein [Streptomyces badius]|uniref:hypothetical protein n=1 Tax=Streptomyces badius TaxID=1941 RepID=UPI00190CC46D|nr:hypothetical protein [Streptomyces badius]